MATLDEIRQDITRLDQELLALLAKRKTLSIEVARAKQANPRPIRDHQREQELLVALIQKGRVLGLDAQYITRIYHTIIEDSVLSQQAYLQSLLNPEQQEPMTSVAYLGRRGPTPPHPALHGSSGSSPRSPDPCSAPDICGRQGWSRNRAAPDRRRWSSAPAAPG